jgi:hypothetical protein
MLISMVDASTRIRRLRRCGTEAKPRAPPTRGNAAADKAFVMWHVERLVEDGHATWRRRRGGTLELTLATGEVFRLGKTTAMRIF